MVLPPLCEGEETPTTVVAALKGLGFLSPINLGRGGRAAAGVGAGAAIFAGIWASPAGYLAFSSAV